MAEQGNRVLQHYRDQDFSGTFGLCRDPLGRLTREAQQGMQDGTYQPTIWSPGDISWVEAVNQAMRDHGKPPLVTKECPTVVYAATGFAIWRPMAEALGWPDKPISWDKIVALAADPQGWVSYGHPWSEGKNVKLVETTFF